MVVTKCTLCLQLENSADDEKSDAKRRMTFIFCDYVDYFQLSVQEHDSLPACGNTVSLLLLSLLSRKVTLIFNRQ